jgi:hypothetical protein
MKKQNQAFIKKGIGILVLLGVIFLQCKELDTFYEIKSPPILETPDDESIFYEPVVNLAWSHKTEAIQTNLYEIWLDNTVLDTVEAALIPQVYNYSIPETAIPPRTEAYSWYVVALNEFQRYQSETINTFFVYPLAEPTLVCEDDTSYCPGAYSFSWSSVTGAAVYEVQFAETQSFENPITQTDSSTTFETTLVPGAYSIQVRAVLNNSHSEWADCSFVVPLDVQEPKIETAVPDGICLQESVDLTWEVDLGHMYSVRIKKDGETSWTELVTHSTTHNYTYTPEQTGTYTWEIQPHTACQDNTEFKSMGSFSVYALPLSNLDNTLDILPGETPTITFVTGTGDRVTDLTFNDSPVTPTGDTATYTDGGLIAGESYDWIWTYTNTQGCAETFTATITVLNWEPPDLDAVGPFCSTDAVVLSWSDESADEYDIEWGTDTLYTTGSTQSSTPTIDIGALSDATYYYRVRQTKAGSTSAWSDNTNYSFVVWSLPDDPNGLNDPTDGPIGATYDFSWTPEVDITYEVQYAIEDYFTWNDADNIDSVNGTADATISDAGTYKFRVRAQNAGGCYSAYVESTEFIVSGGCPDRFFVGTWGQGVYYTENGTNFIQHSDIPTSAQVRDVMRHDICDIWVSVQNQGVYASFDGGLSFNKITSYPLGGAWYACWFDDKVYVAPGTAGNGAYYTEDNGSTMNTVFGGGVDSDRVYTCHADSHHNRIYLVGRDSSITCPRMFWSGTSPYTNNFSHIQPDGAAYAAYAYYVTGPSNPNYPDTHFIGLYQYAFDSLPDLSFPCTPDCYDYGDLPSTEYIMDFTEFGGYVWGAGKSGLYKLTSATSSQMTGIGTKVDSVGVWDNQLWAGKDNLGLYVSSDGSSFNPVAGFPEVDVMGIQHQDD